MSEHFEKYNYEFDDEGYVVTYVEDKAEKDAINSPEHYTAGKIEVIDIIEQTVAGYDDPFVAHCVGTATKYLNRAPYKHVEPTEDLRKAREYLTFAIEHLTKEAEG